ncbi:MAG: thioredoxin domain-containing protein [Ferruginibacter sp.]
MPIKHSNQLIQETSPYLLQHAFNPVHWFTWSDEALQAAKEENKPILISIGYAACHWCHVMEKESFENASVAALMNDFFINIKIDREERPDLDHIYMDAVQAIAGNGGWPLNVFLTPDGKPFYGGTYFPPKKAFNPPSWTDVLYSINDAWQNRRSEIEEQAEQLIDHIKNSNNFGAAKSINLLQQQEELFIQKDCILIAENILKSADTSEGGFGKPPKFLQIFSLQYLIQYSYYFNDTDALKQAELSLQKMLNGGIYDQLGGGMSRYSTDNTWLVPHFEKMLYDNAILISVLCDAYLFTKNEFYKSAISKTILFIMDGMRNADGGYYAAIDADSEGVEGKFYIWQKKEIDQLLGDDSAMYCAYYNIAETGNWDGENILHITTPIQITAAEFNIPPADFKTTIFSCNKKLLAVRNKRIRPVTDDKILLGWNALLLTALCKSYAALLNETYKIAAIQLFVFIEAEFLNTADGSMYHTFKNGQAKYPAFLDDYTYYIQACINLQEITGNQDYLVRAGELTKFVLLHFNDTESDLLFFTNQDQKDVIVRKIELYDGAIPSANAVMTHNLLYLAVVFNEAMWHSKAIRMISAVSEVVKKYPGSFAIWATCFLKLTMGINEVAITGTNNRATLNDVLHVYIPDKVLQSSNKLIDLPLLAGKPYSEISRIYLCKNYQCQQPVTSAKELLLLIKK